MNIKILAGKCSEDNNKQIFNILKDRDKSKNNYIIAPDRSLFSIERRLFDELDESCFFDISVMSFSKLANKIISNTNKNILTKQSGVALVKKLLIDNKDKLLTFGRATNFMGFATSLFETICLFKSCNITVDEIYVDDSSDYSNLKQKDIKLIYSEYEKFLQNDYTDSFNQLKLFADSIKKETFANTNFYIVEFDDFTALMYLIILKIARFSDSTYICTTYNKDGNNSNIYINKVYFDLIDYFKMDGLNYTINRIENNDILVNNLLAYTPSKAQEKNNNFTINAFDNKVDEIKYVVADIYNKVLSDKNYNFGDFAIVLPDFLGYRNDLENELNKYKIPYYFDINEKLCDHTLIRLIFDICYLFDGKFVASDISNIIKNSFLNFSLDSICNFDNYLKRTGLRGFTCFKCDKISDGDIGEFFNKILEWKEECAKCTIVGDYYTIIESIYDYLISRSENYVNNLNPLESRIFEQVKNKFDNIRKDYIGVFGTYAVSFEEFLETYKSYFESSDISLPPITSNTIFVADFERSYISKIPYIYILSCNEGKLPSFKMDNGLITDEEIAKLPNAKQINPTINLINARKTFKQFDIMFRADKHTYLSFYQSSGDGKAYPNTLIKSLVSIYDCDVYNGSNALDFVSNSLNKIDIDNLAFNNMCSDIVVDNILTLTKNWKVYSSYPTYRQMLSLLVNKLDSRDIYTLIDNNQSIAKKISISNCNLFKNNTTSISQIETYYNCPYKHFVRYGLKIDKAVTCELKPNDIGTIIHRVLKLLMPDMLSNKDIDKIYAKSENLLDKILSSEEYINMSSNPMNSYIIIALKKELRRIIEGIVSTLAVSSYKPNLNYLEYSFVNDSIGCNGIKIKGTIDRVDTWKNDFIIIDYKTGDSNFDDYTDVFSGKKLQLLVYAKAFEEKTKCNAKGAFYLPISNSFGKTKQNYKYIGVLDKDNNNIYAMDNGLLGSSYYSNVINMHTTQSGEFAKNIAFYKRMCISSEEMSYLIDFAVNQVNIAIKNILDGDITPRPLKTGNKDICTYCEYMGLCNYQKNNDRCVGSIDTIEDLKNRGGEEIGISTK